MDTGVASRQLRSPWIAYVHLARPAQVASAATDVLAGGLLAYVLASPGSIGWLIWLLAASMGLYAGGVALNDVFDHRRDAVDRPQRPIPSGRVSGTHALLLAILCLAGGIGFAAVVNKTSALLAILIAINAVLYNYATRHQPLLGPLCMGLCRGLNLLLGMSVSWAVLANWWPLMLFPFLVASATTAIRLQQVHGDPRSTAWGASALLLGVTCGLLLLTVEREFQFLMALPFIACFAMHAWPPFLRAALRPQPELAGVAARSGSVSLICLNAAIAAGFGGLVLGACVLLLLPLSQALDRSYGLP